MKLFKFVKRMSYLILVAWMLGVSNIILEETRMVHETRATIEQQEKTPDNNLEEEDTFNFREV